MNKAQAEIASLIFAGIMFIAIIVADDIISNANAANNRPLRYYADGNGTALTYYTNSSTGSNISLWGINIDNPTCEFQIGNSICINGSTGTIQGFFINGSTATGGGGLTSVPVNNISSFVATNNTGTHYFNITVQGGTIFSTSIDDQGLTSVATSNVTNFGIKSGAPNTAQINFSNGTTLEASIGDNSIKLDFLNITNPHWGSSNLTSVLNVNLTTINVSNNTGQTQINLSYTNGTIWTLNLQDTSGSGSGGGNATANGSAGYFSVWDNSSQIGVGSGTMKDQGYGIANVTENLSMQNVSYDRWPVYTYKRYKDLNISLYAPTVSTTLTTWSYNGQTLNISFPAGYARNNSYYRISLVVNYTQASTAVPPAFYWNFTNSTGGSGVIFTMPAGAQNNLASRWYTIEWVLSFPVVSYKGCVEMSGLWSLAAASNPGNNIGRACNATFNYDGQFYIVPSLNFTTNTAANGVTIQDLTVVEYNEQ